MPRHGGSDPGAVNGNIYEKDFNLQSALYIYNRLKELGIPTAITRDTDEFLEREERINRMLTPFGSGSDVIILSNHINAGGGEGAEVVYALRNNGTLANLILDEIGNKGQIKRNVYQKRLPENPSKDYYYIQRLTDDAETVLIEYGFIDSSNDLYKLQNNLNDYNEAVVKAITEYINVPYKLPQNNIEQNINIYTVKKGDSLYSISKIYNTTVDELKRINNLNTNFLSIGQQLIIPTIEDEKLQEDYQIYTIKKGDTLYSIANNYNTTVNELVSLNKLNSTQLTIGQQILIPPSDVQIIGSFEYIVKPGDSLWKLSNICNVDVDKIIESNKLQTTIIQPGQKILLPDYCTITDKNINDENIYIVQPNDTLYSIARRYNTTIDKIINDNNLTTNMLSIGQQLIINKDEVSTTNYIVQPNDTLYSISRMFNTTPEIIKEINNLQNNLIKTNQILKIPN